MIIRYYGLWWGHRKDYFELPYAALRCLVEPKVAERSIMNHSAYLKKAKVVISSAEIATKTEVTRGTGEIIPFDFLVICTGSTYSGPPTRSEWIQEYQKGTFHMFFVIKLRVPNCYIAIFACISLELFLHQHRNWDLFCMNDIDKVVTKIQGIIVVRPKDLMEVLKF